MGNEWVERNVEEVANVFGGGTPSTKDEANFNGEIPWITPKDLSGYPFRYISRGERNISKKGLNCSNAKLLPVGTVLLTTRAPVGYVAIAANPVTTNQGFHSLVPHNGYSSEFIYYLLKANAEYLKSNASGTTFGELSGSTLKRLKFVFPSIPEQRAIADVLGSLDDKIELNRRMNATLESMARAVFKAWFMENEEAKGWKIGQIKDLGDVVCGKTPPTNDKENYDGDIPFITIPDMHNKVFITQTRKTLSEKGAQTQSKKTLPVFAICVSCIATPGLVSLTTKPSQTNQQINNLVPNDKKSVFYCYYALRALADEIRARGSGGSVVVNLNKGQFEILPVVIPPATKLHEFQEQVEPLFLRLLANENESRTLAALRDALLPRLMSGEVRVGEG